MTRSLSSGTDVKMKKLEKSCIGLLYLKETRHIRSHVGISFN